LAFFFEHDEDAVDKEDYPDILSGF